MTTELEDTALAMLNKGTHDIVKVGAVPPWMVQAGVKSDRTLSDAGRHHIETCSDCSASAHNDAYPVYRLRPSVARTAVCPSCKVETAVPDEWPDDDTTVA